MLCNVCSNIHFKPRRDWALPEGEAENFKERNGTYATAGQAKPPLYYFHHKDFEALKASANHGCHFCIMLWRVFSQPKSDFAPREPAELAAGPVALFLENHPSEADASFSSMRIDVHCAEQWVEGRLGLVSPGNISTCNSI